MANNGFPTEKLGSLCLKVGSGATPRGGSKVYLDKGEIALIRSQNVYNDGFNREGLVYITAEHAEQLSNVTVEPEDVLLNITGDSVARCCQVDPRVLPARVNQHVSIIRPKPDELIPRFLRYFLVSPTMQAQMLSWAHAGATRKALTKGMIESFKVPKPDLTIQQRIAHILGTLDDKIELNRRMNRTLEKMATAIFKSWFIDFDPVRAKVEGQDTGLPKEIADLFPDSFEDSEIGPIPKGWDLKPIGEAVRCVGGATPSTKNPEFWEGGKHPFVTPKDMSSLQSPVILDSERHITDAGVDKISSKQLPVGTVILSSRAPIGYLGVATVPVSVNQGVIAMICDGDLPNLYVLHWTAANMDLIKSRAGGTTFAEISKRNFRPIPVLVPVKPVLDAFMTNVAPLHERITLNVRQNYRLARLRDTLLPKLLNGELEVPDAEELVETNI